MPKSNRLWHFFLQLWIKKAIFERCYLSNTTVYMLNTRDLLKQYGLRHTDCRESVIQIFLQSEHALAHADVEEMAGKDFDRVTIYRTLRTFLDKGVIHKVLDDLSFPKYAICKAPCSSHKHEHAHVHFKCNQCGQTNCLENVTIPTIVLPKGYIVAETNLLINGTCLQCKVV